ncbi:MAG: chorismate--pyruvate lyase family protein [Legionella sp.]
MDLNVDIVKISGLPPPSLLPWLSHQSAITTKLEEEIGPARLEILQQQWLQPNDWDRNTLQIKSLWVMHREIVMWFQREPCWYARTILPQTTYLHDPAFFQRLRQESLGKLLFDNNRIKRFSLKVYALTPQAPEYLWLDETLHERANHLWARLSQFNMDDQFPLFLLEVFLPGLERLIL